LPFPIRGSGRLLVDMVVMAELSKAATAGSVSAASR
jgi:hypothetical protein